MSKKLDTEKFRFIVEIPLELHERLQNEAAVERRNRNAQVIRILEERYTPRRAKRKAKVEAVAV